MKESRYEFLMKYQKYLWRSPAREIFGKKESQEKPMKKITAALRCSVGQPFMIRSSVRREDSLDLPGKMLVYVLLKLVMLRVQLDRNTVPELAKKHCYWLGYWLPQNAKSITEIGFHLAATPLRCSVGQPFMVSLSVSREISPTVPEPVIKKKKNIATGFHLAVTLSRRAVNNVHGPLFRRSRG